MEARAARRGTRLHTRLVLRHTDDYRRLLRRHGCRSHEDFAYPSRDRRAGGVQSHRGGDGQRLRHAERYGTWPDLGVGTGFSARRAMGLGAMKLADMEEYIRVVYGLLNGETLETSIEGKRKKIRFLNPDFGLINTRDPIRLHVSAYGPKSQALTAKLNAGWKSFISDVPGAMSALESMQQSWQSAGRNPADLYATAWACGCVLQDGEP